MVTPWQGPHDNIPPNGIYAQGFVTRDYDEGDVIVTRVQITADHKGYFEFKLCPNNGVTKPVTQECLDMTVLTIVNASRTEPTRYYTHGTDYTTYDLHVQLPVGVYCNQVVLQWRYHTGRHIIIHSCIRDIVYTFWYRCRTLQDGYESNRDFVSSPPFVKISVVFIARGQSQT